MKKDIVDLHKIWIETEVADKYGILEFCSDDIETSTTSENRIKGKTNFLNWLKESDDGSTVENIEISNRQVICVNQMGALKADFKTTIRTKDNQTHIVSGQHMWHLIIEEGAWKVKRLTWKITQNSNR